MEGTIQEFGSVEATNGVGPLSPGLATMVDDKKSKERLKKFQTQKNPAKKWKCMRKILGTSACKFTFALNPTFQPSNSFLCPVHRKRTSRLCLSVLEKQCRRDYGVHSRVFGPSRDRKRYGTKNCSLATFVSAILRPLYIVRTSNSVFD